MKKIIALMLFFSIIALPVFSANPAYTKRVERVEGLPEAANARIIRKVPLFEVGDNLKGSPGTEKDQPDGGQAATGVLGSGLSESAEKYAVIIGICDYPGTVNDLCESDGDSLHMYKALTTLYGYDPDNIYLFKDMGEKTCGGTYFEEDPGVPGVTAQAPTKENIMEALGKIKKDAVSEDEIVFFFSGHGGDGEAEDGDSETVDEGIVVHGDDETDTDENIAFIWDGELRDEFNGINAARIVPVFDSCLAGGMDDVAGEGRVVAMATGETQSAYVYSTAGEDVDGDGVKDGEGVFTRYFVNEGMLAGLGDAYDHDEDGVLEEGTDATVEEAFDYARGNIPPNLKHRQQPVINDRFANDLLFGWTGLTDQFPTVSIINPGDGEIVSGKVTITADAGDDNGVEQVEFLVDDNSVGVDSDNSDGWSVLWDTTSCSDGSHTVSAVATDTAGQTASDSVSVTVDNEVDSELSVTSITPDEIKVGTTTDVTISGSGFEGEADVSFEGGQGPAPIASNIAVTDSTAIEATVTVKSGGPPKERMWDVRVTNPDGSSAVLPDGLIVTL